MDRGGDELIGWSIDGIAAALLGAAVGACLLMLGLPREAVMAGPAAGLAALAALRMVRPEPRKFRLRSFALDGFDAEEAADVLDLTDVLDIAPLELEDVLPQADEDSRVVQLFAPRAFPTPGELARRIDDHLGQAGEESRGGKVLELEVDAAAALRQALGDLRRSLA
ncbi:hypothetical protein [Sphingomonas humi]|uniref:Uncharacterized protein n=1 Tax=Sphingomonas humi TaxID=335630 RepID=A0ABP7SC74_9SPHN